MNFGYFRTSFILLRQEHSISRPDSELSADRCEDDIKSDGITDQDEIDMREQNLNPVKVLCSGYEGQLFGVFLDKCMFGIELINLLQPNCYTNFRLLYVLTTT